MIRQRRIKSSGKMKNYTYRGFPIGEKISEGYNIFNHLSITIQVHKSDTNKNYYRIVGVIVEPKR